MQERTSRYDSRSRRDSSSSRASNYDRSSRRGSSGRGSSGRSSSGRGISADRSSSGRRRDMGSIRDERRRNGTPSQQRLRDVDSQMRRTPNRQRGSRTPQGGYRLQNRPINFAGKRSGYDPQIIIVGGIAIAIIILLIFFIVSCAASCGAEEGLPEANVSEALSGDLRTSVEQLVTRDYQSTYVAEHADQYPTDLVQLMVDEPASTEFVYNYPNASRDAQTYEEQVAKGSVPLLYDWDARWGYVEYAGSVIGVTGSGPTSVAMARMALLGAGDVTPATVANYVTQLGGATGDSYMAATLFGSATPTSSNQTASDAVDEDGDGYDDETGEYIGDTQSQGDESQGSDASGQGGASASTDSSGQNLATMIGVSATPITVEPGSSVTDSLVSRVKDGAYVLVETTSGAFGTKAHWVLVIGVNNDGSVAVYDPTSVANSLHPWDPGTVIDGSSSLIALSVPGSTGNSESKSDHVDEDGDGYDDETGEYIGDDSESGDGSEEEQ